MLIEQVAERANGDVQQLGRTRLVAAGLPQGLDDVGLFEDFDVAGEINPVIGKRKLGGDAFGIVVRYVVGKLLGLDLGRTIKC